MEWANTMKINKELAKGLLLGGMVVLFILIAMSYAFDKDNVEIFVNGDKIDRDIISIGSIASTADKYEFDPEEEIDISMKVTNDLNQDYDFKVMVWKENILGSKEIIVYESDPVTIEKDKSFTFSTEYRVPLEPGTYFISTISYYAPIGHMNFATYDDGTYFIITVLDTTPVVHENDAEETPTPTPTATGTPITLVTDVPCPIETYDEESFFDFIDLEDENTQIGIALIIMALIPVIGFFVIRYRKK